MTNAFIAVRTVEELLALCRAVDRASAEQLEEIAESFAMSNNRETARELQALAEWKATHAADGAKAAAAEWFVVDPGDPGALHYLMRPWHAVRLALDNEDRILTGLQDLAARPTDTGLRSAVDGLLARQRDHMTHLERRLAELPPPEDGWDEDPDPPFFDQ